MNRREFKVERSYTISIGDLIFEIRTNGLFITHPQIGTLHSYITSDEMVTLSQFCQKATDILQPIPGNTLVYINESGPQTITIYLNEKNNYSLLINSQLQFMTESEEIYHEALVGPAVCSLKETPEKFLILGGGDGLVAKQIFKENPTAEVLLVDFDKNITDIFTYDDHLNYFNEKSMEKCKVLNEDAFSFVETHVEKYDMIVCDFPDPDHDIFNKLYSAEFYTNVKKLLKEDGVLAVQSGSLVSDSKCFKCIKKTIDSLNFKTITFYTPSSYGDLVYTLAKLDEIPNPEFKKSKREYRTLSQEYFDKAMTTFRPDMWSNEEVEINTVNNYKALEYRINELYYGKGRYEKK